MSTTAVPDPTVLEARLDRLALLDEPSAAAAGPAPPRRPLAPLVPPTPAQQIARPRLSSSSSGWSANLARSSSLVDEAASALWSPLKASSAASASQRGTTASPTTVVDTAASTSSHLPTSSRRASLTATTPSSTQVLRGPGASTLSVPSAASSYYTAPDCSVQLADIGVYDGALERDKRRPARSPEAQPLDFEAEAELALDSSNVPESHRPTRAFTLSSFEIGKPLGKGKFGRVYLARTKAEPKYIVALKCLYKEEIVAHRLEKQVRREIEIQSQLAHPNLLRLHGYFHDERRIFLIVEFAANGQVMEWLSRSGCFTEKRSSRYVAQVAEALAYLHAKHVIHRDIKPENILIGLDGQLKLADFGLSVHAPSDRRTTFCGTPDYMAPEMLDYEIYSSAVDLWALGVLTYEFLVGRAPFADDAGSDATYAKIRALDYEIPSSVSKEARDLITKLLCLEPSSRLSLEEVRTSPWIEKYEKHVRA